MEYLARRRTCHTFVWIEYLNSYGATRLISLNVSTCIAAKRVSQPSNLYSNSSSNRLRFVFSIRFSPSNNISPTSQKSVEIRGNWDHGCVQAPQIPERKRKLANLPTTVTFVSKKFIASTVHHWPPILETWPGSQLITLSQDYERTLGANPRHFLHVRVSPEGSCVPIVSIVYLREIFFLVPAPRITLLKRPNFSSTKRYDDLFLSLSSTKLRSMPPKIQRRDVSRFEKYLRELCVLIT